MSMDLREQKFGIEIELTGLTRKRAAEVIGKYLGQEPHYDGGYYEEYSVRDEQGRKWKVMYDSSIVAVKKGGGSAGDEYKVEFVSPMEEMHAYGYTWDGMLPLTKERALELLDTELVLHKLYDDGAEAMLETKDEILSHDGLFGVEKDSWMNYLESQSQNETNGMIQEM